MPGEPAGQTALTRLTLVADKLWNRESRPQYAAICYRRTGESSCPIEILLITSRGTGRWVIPKGWPMGKKKPHEVASQEAWEEAGVRGRVRKRLGVTSPMSRGSMTVSSSRQRCRFIFSMSRQRKMTFRSAISAIFNGSARARRHLRSESRNCAASSRDWNNEKATDRRRRLQGGLKHEERKSL